MNGTIKERIIKKGKDNRGKTKENLKVYDVYYRFQDPVTGKWKQTSKKGFRNKGDAEKYLLKVNSQIIDNTFVPVSRMTVREYLTDWLNDYVKLNLRASSIAGYKNNIEKHILPYIGNVELQGLTTLQIDELYKKLLKNGRSGGKEGLSPKSVLYVHRVLTKALGMAEKQSIVQRNTASFASPPKVRKPKCDIYEKDEIKALLDYLKNTDMEVPIALAAICGMRRGEVLGLMHGDICFNNNTIQIQRQLIPTKEGPIFEQPKSEDSNRIINAPQEVMAMIKQHLDRQEGYKKMLGEEYQDNGLINCYPDGRMIDPRNFSKMFAKILKDAGLKHIKFHALRHSAATLMLSAGVPMKVASQILGHSTIGITADLYQHVVTDMKKEAAEKVRNILFSNEENGS